MAPPGRLGAIVRDHSAVENSAARPTTDFPFAAPRRSSFCPKQAVAQPGAPARRPSPDPPFRGDPTAQTTLPPTAQIAARFGLTATEAEVARLAAMGRGMPFVAEAMGVSISTARTHLKAVYEKSGVNHQAGLARLMALTLLWQNFADPISFQIHGRRLG